MQKKTQPQVGDQYKEFVFTKVLPIKELELTLYELEHEKSGAKVMHLANDDKENLFCISFKTFADSSNGAPHILEHTVLCGSKKFPVKDPFFSMNRRSLNTFMNAMTGDDFTCYPAASQVEKDFYNLLEVYLDAVFSPELKEMSFKQEGIRIEVANPKKAKESPLEFKGIVFNEMKGSLSSPDSRLWHAMMEHLLPDLPYTHNSGGDPKEIPNLTYKQLKEFHATYYHPSRALFFFYGNLPLEKHLDFLMKNALEGARKQKPLPPLGKQKRFTQPKELLLSYPFQEKEKKEKTIIAFGFLTTTLSNQEELLALTVLDSLLMETDASPLKLALLQSELCRQADGHMDTEMSEIPYVIVCHGCEEKNREKLRECLFDTLKKIAKEGFLKQKIEAALHQIEFSRLEITGDYGPFGLTLFMRSALAKQHGSPPENALCIYSQFQKLQKKLEDPSYLPSLLHKYFIDNPHFIALTMRPDETLAQKEEAEEKERLSKIKAKLSSKEIETLIHEGEALREFQEKAENQSVDCLPKLALSDVPKKIVSFPLTTSEKKPLTLFHHSCFTNHILFAELLFDLPEVSEKELPYLQLFLSFLPNLGVGKRDYTENLDYITAYLGGFQASLQFYPQIGGAGKENELRPSFSLRGKALERNIPKLFSLFTETLASPRLDEKERIKELLLQIHTGLENKLSQNALSYAKMLSLSSFSLASSLGEALGGIHFLFFIRKLVENLDQNLPLLLEELKKIKEKLFHLNAPTLILSCDMAGAEKIVKENFFGLKTLPSKPFTPWKGDFAPKKKESGAWTINSPVAFSALGFKTATLLDRSSAALSIATKLLDNTYLHKKIREQGGAYGGGSSYNPSLGLFHFFAYRDPHIASSLNHFEKSIEKIAKGDFSADELEEAKLGILQNLDTPISPGSRAMTSYVRLREGKTDEVRQVFRDKLLSASKKEVQEAVGEKLLIQKKEGVFVTFAGKELIEKEQKGLDAPLPVFKI